MDLERTNRRTAEVETKGGLDKQTTDGRRQLQVFHLFVVKSLWSIEWLYERRRMANEQCVAGGSGQHTDHGQPCVSCALRWISTEPNAQHVRQGLKQRPSVLLRPFGMLQKVKKNNAIIALHIHLCIIW